MELTRRTSGKRWPNIKGIDEIAAHFQIGGKPDAVERYGSGHINDTFVISTNTETGSRRFILQRINRRVFKNPEAVMQNIRRVVGHLDCPSLVPTHQGHSFLIDNNGDYWRTYLFVDGAISFDVVRDPAQARSAASMYGKFQRRLADLPGERLHEIIPGFHDTPARFTQLHEAIHSDSKGRATDCAAEIEQALAWEKEAATLVEAHRAGKLPERITHNDTKLNNVLFDENSGEPLCVIDLDTVMPGLVAYDFGDMVRTATSTVAEDEWIDAHMQLEYFEALAEGYLGATAGWLTQHEIDYLPIAGKIITIETGLRFLTDHLNGDKYFRIRRPGQNLDSCRGQFALAVSMEEQFVQMRDSVAHIASRLPANKTGVQA